MHMKMCKCHRSLLLLWSILITIPAREILLLKITRTITYFIIFPCEKQTLVAKRQLTIDFSFRLCYTPTKAFTQIFSCSSVTAKRKVQVLIWSKTIFLSRKMTCKRMKKKTIRKRMKKNQSAKTIH